MQALQNKLYKIANEIVGNVGEPTNTRIAVNGEEYITFLFITNDKKEIKNIWTKWIKACVLFKQLAKPEGEAFSKEPTLYIFWRTLPKITESDGRVGVFARLLISRFKRNPFAADKYF
jgi:hypothetical protein